MTAPRRANATRATADGRAYLDLRSEAKKAGRATAEYLRLYALEGFLTRLAVSPHARHLVLKGGVLLAAYDLRRPTADIDFAALAQSREIDHVRQLVVEVARTVLPPGQDDGLQFDTSDAHAESIRDEDEYNGVRVTLRARLATANETFHVDVNVGDPIWPQPETVHVPRLLGGQIDLLGYPIPMVLAEKVVTAAQRGTASTRWRDFGDIYLLTGSHSFDARAARGALLTVAAHRGADLRPLRGTLDGYAELAQTRYRRWRDRQHLQDRLPDQFGELLEATVRFADPLLDPTTVPDTATWAPATRDWSP